MPWVALASIIGAVTDLVIHVARWQGVRMVGEVAAGEALRAQAGQAWETETAWPRPVGQGGACHEA